MKTREQKFTSESGTVLSMALIMIVVLASIAAALVSTTAASHQEGRQVREDLRSFYAAEGALIEALAILRAGDTDAFDGTKYPREIDGSSYTVTATYGDTDPTLGDDLILLQAVATDGTESNTLSLLLRASSAAQQLPWQVFSDDDVLMNSNSYIDAYCSTDGPWSRQRKQNWHGAKYVSDTARIGSNGQFELDSNSAVMGDANPGVGKRVSTASNSKVFGASTPLAEPIEIETVSMPAGLTPSGSYVLKDKKKTLGPGEFAFTDMTLDGNTKLTIVSPTTIYLSGSFEMNSNAVLTTDTGLADGVTIFLTQERETVLLESNSDMIANVHAPGCDVELNSNSEITGYVLCDSLYMDSNAAIHVDTCYTGGYSSGSGTTEFEVVSWVPTGADPH